MLFWLVLFKMVEKTNTETPQKALTIYYFGLSASCRLQLADNNEYCSAMYYTTLGTCIATVCVMCRVPVIMRLQHTIYNYSSTQITNTHSNKDKR